MIIVHYDQNTGEIISAYGSDIENPPYPNIVITDNYWNSLVGKRIKVDLNTKKIASLEKKLTDEEVDSLRRAAYEQEADPLFFKYQRKEIKKEVWLDKVKEIKTRYPKSN